MTEEHGIVLAQFIRNMSDTLTSIDTSLKAIRDATLVSLTDQERRVMYRKLTNELTDLEVEKLKSDLEDLEEN